MKPNDRTCDEAMPVLSIRFSIVVGLLGFLLLPLQAASEDAEDVPATIIGGHLTDQNPFLPGSKKVRFPVTVFLRDDRIRVDFTGPRQERGRLLYDSETRVGWLADLENKIAVPVDALAVRGFAALRVDPDSPCAQIAKRCERGQSRFIAGHVRTGYRFRDAAGKGPGGLSAGEFWVDAEHGVILAYRGLGLSREASSMLEADFVVTDVLPNDYFELSGFELPSDAAKSE